MSGPKTIQERELMFRRFIKLRAKGRKRSAIERDLGIYANFFIPMILQIFLRDQQKHIY